MNRIKQEASRFSTYRSLLENARTNIAMQNNPSYWHIEAGSMIDYTQRNYPDGFSYCRGCFVVEQLSPTLILRPIYLGPLGLWQVEQDVGIGFDEIIRSGINK